MKKIKPNLKKMFNIHTIILVLVFVLQQEKIEGRLQTKHSHYSHKQHNNYHNADDNDVKQHHHNHHHHHHHHQQGHEQQVTTPSIEFTTSSSAVNSDNEFLIKDEFSKTKNNNSFSPHLTNQNDHTIQELSLNSTTTIAPNQTLSNSIFEHIHHKHHNRFVPTPLPPQLATYLSAQNSNNHRLDLTAKYSNPYESSKLNSATVDHQATNEQQKQQHHYSSKQEYDDVQQRQQEDADYYEDYNEDDSDAVDDNDGISDEVNNNLSDRSYARITRSKLDDDYADDEPYRNDHQMQRDGAPGVLTEQKYLEVGNEKAVLQARERYIQEQKRPRTPHELATEHWHRMIQATKCRKPLPRVIPVSNNTSKRYEPYATILHRCGEDTGCCGSTASVCTVKRYEVVIVYVFSYDFNYRKEIEALPMHNHTECHCVNRGSLLHDSTPRDKRSGGGGYEHHSQRQQKQQQRLQAHSQTQDLVPTDNYHHHQQKWKTLLGCHCPRNFNVFEDDVERHAHLPRPHSVFTRKCRCDCLINNKTCLRFKHGEEGFSLEDRKCILEYNCKPPVCSYGDYNLQTGRCPSYRSHFLQFI